MYTLVVFLKKHTQIKNDIPTINNEIGGGKHNTVLPAKTCLTENDRT
jgi:hypothetical protein